MDYLNNTRLICIGIDFNVKEYNIRWKYERVILDSKDNPWNLSLAVTIEL